MLVEFNKSVVLKPTYCTMGVNKTRNSAKDQTRYSDFSEPEGSTTFSAWSSLIGSVEGAAESAVLLPQLLSWLPLHCHTAVTVS